LRYDYGLPKTGLHVSVCMKYLAKSTAPAYICCNWHALYLGMTLKCENGSSKLTLLPIRRELQP